MKLQLDTTNKVIKLESSIELGELVKQLEKLLPKGEWKQFTLETNTTIQQWVNPYFVERIREVPVNPWPRYPWYCSSSGISGATLGESRLQSINKSDFQLKSGLYNVEI